MDWLEIINKGRPMVLILIGYSLVALTIVIERLLYFGRLASGRPEILPFRCKAPWPGGLDDQAGSPETAGVRGMIAAASYKTT